MHRLTLFLITICIIMAFSVPALAQNHSLSSAFHISDQASYLGATFTENFVGLNRGKVKLRGTLSFLTGTNNFNGTGDQPADRVEFGLATKNTIIKGRALFNVIDFGYYYSRTDELNGENRVSGPMFAFGLGTRLASSVSVLGKYVTGRDSGARFVMEVDF